MSKKQTFTILISIGILITLIIVVIPIVVLAGIKTNTVCKLNQFVMHDELNSTTITVSRDSYGFNSASEYNRYYLSADVAKVHAVISEQIKAEKIVANGAVLYIQVGNGQFYFMRMMNNTSVPSQGYEYNTSNKSELVSYGAAKRLVDIYLPYHMLDVAVNVEYGSNESRGIYEYEKEYTLCAGSDYDDLLAFYEQDTKLEVKRQDDRIIITHSGGTYYIKKTSDRTIAIFTDDVFLI